MPLMRKAWSFVRAITGGRDARLIRGRMAICEACPQLKKVPFFDEFAGIDRERLFCGQCGCGTHGLATLGHKLGYAKLKCPMCSVCGNPSKDYARPDQQPCVCAVHMPKWGEATGLTPQQATQVLNIKERARVQAETAEQQVANMPTGGRTGQMPPGMPGQPGQPPFPPGYPQQAPGQPQFGQPTPGITQQQIADSMRPVHASPQQNADAAMRIPDHLPEATKVLLRNAHAKAQQQAAEQQQAQAALAGVNHKPPTGEQPAATENEPAPPAEEVIDNG